MPNVRAVTDNLFLHQLHQLHQLDQSAAAWGVPMPLSAAGAAPATSEQPAAEEAAPANEAAPS